MNFRLRTAAAGILAASLVVSYAVASDDPAPAKKHAAARKAATPPGPTVEEQIESLRQEFQGQIDGLKSNLADKDVQLKQAAAGSGGCAGSRSQGAGGRGRATAGVHREYDGRIDAAEHGKGSAGQPTVADDDDFR